MRNITIADYLIEFLISNDVTDVFGYQGGMVCHIFDSLGIYSDQIEYHSCGNEQGAALAACGYAQATGKLGVVITTSGPGFTNALTGVANAWFDSVPLMLISGQVNTKDKRRNYTFRQYGFQEIQAVNVAAPITKATFEIDDDTDVVDTLNQAYKIAMDGRKGPVYLDFPINIGRNMIEVNGVEKILPETPMEFDTSNIMDQLLAADKPIIMAGAGINQAGMRKQFRKLVDALKIPVVTSMPGIDLLPTDSPYMAGFFGGTARREAGVVLHNTDFVLSLGTRLCNKAIGYDHEQFIPKAKKFIRVEIDEKEFERQLKDCEEDVVADLRSFIPNAVRYAQDKDGQYDHLKWVESVNEMKQILSEYDLTFGNKLLARFTSMMPDRANLTFDVGNNLVYGVQSSIVKNATCVFMSAGLGSMGYSIPASLGVCIGTKLPTFVITGDGGAQMNIQELNTIAKKHLPVKLLVLNNKALGHIILFQEHYLDNRFVATTEDNNDYYSCDFAGLAKAYGIQSIKIHTIKELDICEQMIMDDEPCLIEVEYENCTMLPNIHGGLDTLINGPELPVEVVQKVRAIME